jgi:hypothetical protein
MELHWSLVLVSLVEQLGPQQPLPMHSRTEAVEVPMLQAQQQTQASLVLVATVVLVL